MRYLPNFFRKQQVTDTKTINCLPSHPILSHYISPYFWIYCGSPFPVVEEDFHLLSWPSLQGEKPSQTHRQSSTTLGVCILSPTPWEVVPSHRCGGIASVACTAFWCPSSFPTLARRTDERGPSCRAYVARYRGRTESSPAWREKVLCCLWANRWSWACRGAIEYHAAVDTAIKWFFVRNIDYRLTSLFRI